MYAIEIRELRRKLWGRAGTVDAYTTRFTARNLVVNYEYFFRVRAINKEGEGPALEGYDSACPKMKLGKKIFFLTFYFPQNDKIEFETNFKFI